MYYFNLVHYFICKGFFLPAANIYNFICNNFCKVEIWSTNYMANNFLFTLLVYGLIPVILQPPKHIASIYNFYTEVVQWRFIFCYYLFQQQNEDSTP